jgi:alpha-L-arabinofuranosidase
LKKDLGSGEMRVRKRSKLLAVATLVSAACNIGIVTAAQQAESSGSEALHVTVDTRQTAAPISKYLYGGFIEHGGLLMYRSLWAEMIDDRKFYFPITSQEPPAPPRRPGGGGFRNMQLHPWHPVGPDEIVVMDKDRPFVGDQSPRIELDPSTPHGIRQGGMSLVKGKQYSGRIYLRGTPGSTVKVSLIWGDGADDRQTLTFSALTNEYTKLPLHFTAKTDTSSGAIEIAGTGSGNFHVGTLSLMSTDNVQGFRPDTIALLRDLHAGMWRLPGGNFISDWDWHNSVGNIDRRPPVFDYAWNAMQSNDLGMDELMTLCKLIGVDPYITVNAGFGDSHSAAQEVEYLNGSARTRWGAMRAKNGHPEPYHVKFWDIGNEPYGSWQLGHTELKYYVIKHNEFAKAMRAVDPSITLLASGAMPDEMTVEGQPKTMGIADPQVKLGSDIDWTNGLLKNCMGNFDGLTEHWYTRVGKYFDYKHAESLPLDSPIEAGYVDLPETELEFARHPANRVHKKAEEWAAYEKLYPAMAEKKIFLSIDEYGYGGGSLKATLAYGMILNEMFRHTDFLKMAAYTMAVSTLDYSPTAATYNSRGLLYKMYREHFGTIPVALSGNSPQPAPTRPPYGDQPETGSGSPTYPLDMIAALTDDHKYLTIAVVNATEQEHAFDLNAAGVKIGELSAAWQLSGGDLDADNHVGQPQQIFVKQIPPDGSAGAIAVAPNSVTIYKFAVQ